jgi:hypothetical protein
MKTIIALLILCFSSTAFADVRPRSPIPNDFPQTIGVRLMQWKVGWPIEKLVKFNLKEEMESPHFIKYICRSTENNWRAVHILGHSALTKFDNIYKLDSLALDSKYKEEWGCKQITGIMPRHGLP